MERKVREMTKMDITATYRHEYSTKFIIDESADFSRLAEMNLEPYERIFLYLIRMFLICIGIKLLKR